MTNTVKVFVRLLLGTSAGEEVMFEMYIVGLYAAIHVLFAVKAAISTKLLNPNKRVKWIALSLAFGFVGHFIYYSLQLDDEYQALRN